MFSHSAVIWLCLLEGTLLSHCLFNIFTKDLQKGLLSTLVDNIYVSVYNFAKANEQEKYP